MHEKFVLIDNETLLNGSYNWSTAAATGNKENIVITDSSKLIRKFSHEFTLLFASKD